MTKDASTPPVAIIMGSQSDWPVMRNAAETLDALGIAYSARIVSAHRTPKRLYDFASGAKGEGFKVIIAGAGGAAHLPGMTSACRSRAARFRARIHSCRSSRCRPAFPSERSPSAAQAR